MEFYERLKKARVQAGLNQSEVAEKIGTSQRMITRYENGITEPTVTRFKELCKLYKASADEILELN